MSRALHRKIPTVLQKSKSASCPQVKLSTYTRTNNHASDLKAKIKCHPTFLCDIQQEISTLWYSIPRRLLPKNWSCDWREYQRCSWFEPLQRSYPQSYNMGSLDIVLQGFYGVSHPVRGVMYGVVQWRTSYRKQPPTQLHECVVLQDALGDYYYHYEFCQGGGEFVAKFRTPRGTPAEDFVKHYFKGAVNGVDMDQVPCGCRSKYDDLVQEQKELAKLWQKAIDVSCCACVK